MIPYGNITGPANQPFNAGQVNALTTVVAETLQLEQAAAPNNPNQIAGNQQPNLNHHVQGEGFSQSDQQMFISNPNSLMNQAVMEVGPTANEELGDFNTNPTQATATAALNGLLGNVRVGHGQGCQLSSTLQTAIVNAASSKQGYTPAAVAAALTTALQLPSSQSITAAQVTAAVQQEQKTLTNLLNSGANLSPVRSRRHRL